MLCTSLLLICLSAPAQRNIRNDTKHTGKEGKKEEYINFMQCRTLATSNLYMSVQHVPIPNLIQPHRVS